MHAIVLTFDRLPAHLLSCLGNEWIETPTIDRLASISAVFEQHFVEIPAAAGPTHSWWRGEFEYFKTIAATRSELEAPLLKLTAAGTKSCLLAEKLEGLPTELFAEYGEVSGDDGLHVAPEQVPFAKLVQSAIERLKHATSEQPSLLWLHSRGVPDVWLPPRLFAELYLDELDVEPEVVFDDDGRQIEQPRQPGLSDVARSLLDQCAENPEVTEVVFSEQLFATIDEEFDSDGEDDEVRSDVGADADADPEMTHDLRRVSKLVFAGYVSLLDRLLGPLIEAIEENAEPTLLIVTAACGQSFGERGEISSENDCSLASDDLQDATLRTPLIVWRSDRTGFGSRHQELHQPCDVPATLLDWFGIGDRTQQERSLLRPTGLTQALHFSPNGAIGIRDRHWLLVADAVDDLQEQTTEEEVDEATESLKLYVKPSDYWNVFDVAAQEPDEVNRLSELLRQQLARARNDGNSAIVQG